MRLFVAIEPPPEIHRKMVQFIEQAQLLAPEARFVRLEGLHLTLKFVGEAGEEQVQRMQQALAHIKGAPFAIRFRGFGFFPNAVRPAHFWIGAEGGESLPSLAYMVNKELGQAGIPEEDKPYRPHVTLARAGRGAKKHPFADLQRKIASMADYDFGAMTAREYFLYDSRLSPGGSHYSKLATFSL